MTNAIIRSQVRQAIRISPCDVPDFMTREKATLVWSKVYIARDGNQFRFVELNLIERILRYIAGCTCYKETILDKATLKEVKEYIHEIKDSPSLHDSIGIHLFPLVKSSTDVACYRNLLGECQTLPDLDDLALQDIRMLQDDLWLIEDLPMNYNFSDGFLSKALELAKQHSQNKELMMQVFAGVFHMYANGVLNTTLMHEVMGLSKKNTELGLALHSQKISIPAEAAAKFKGAVDLALPEIKRVADPTSLQDGLKSLGRLEKLQQELNDLPGQVISPILEKSEGQKMIATLQKSLTDLGAHPVLVDAYLGDTDKIAGRLAYHVNINGGSYESYGQACEQLREKIEWYQKGVARALDREYKALSVQFTGLSFLPQCLPLGLKEIPDFISRVVEQLKTDPACQELVEARLSKEYSLREYTLEMYCDGIRGNLIATDLPEMRALAQVSGRPVLLVQNDWQAEQNDWQFEWMAGYNLDADKEPLIFNFDRNMWTPLKKK